ncbi:MAG: methyl-accepting chemotaxis protein [Fervidobacterium sp.]
MIMKLSWKYSIISAILIFGTLTIFVSFIMLPKSIDTIKNVALKSFLSEVKVLSRIRYYDFIDKIQPEVGYYYVISDDGITLMHQDNTKIGIDVKTTVPGLFEYMLKVKTGIYSYNYEGTKRYVAFAFDGDKFVVHAAREDELFADLKKLNSFMLRFFIPLSVIVSLIIGYIFGEFLINPTKNQYKAATELLNTVFENIVSTASSAEEIKSVAHNTEEASLELNKAVEELAAYFEESRAEVETTLNRIRDFTNTIEEITHSVSELTSTIESLSGIAEKITEVSDNITVLAINASIETSKETIDKDGLSRIAEMIMELSASTRTLAKESKDSLKDVEKVVAATVLITEKISKEVNYVRDSLNVINQVVNASTQNSDKVARVSRAVQESVEELYAGIEQLEEAINNVRIKASEFAEELKSIKL